MVQAKFNFTIFKDQIKLVKMKPLFLYLIDVLNLNW
jgi:hypothetical protein